MRNIFILFFLCPIIITSYLTQSTVLSVDTRIGPNPLLECKKSPDTSQQTDRRLCCENTKDPNNPSNPTQKWCWVCGTDKNTGQISCSGKHQVARTLHSGQANNEGNAGIIQEPPKKGSQDTNIGNNAGVFIDSNNMNNSNNTNILAKKSLGNVGNPLIEKNSTGDDSAGGAGAGP